MIQASSVVIIGSGVAGLATAIRLRHMGFEVTVIEANAYPGGKLSSLEIKGYRFDAGPSLFTLPQLVDELFVFCGRNPRDYFNYTKLDILCHYFYEDGTRISAYSDVEKFACEAELKTGEPGEKILQYLNESKRIYEITEPVFLKNSLHRISTYFERTTLTAIPKLPSLRMFQTMHQYHQKHFQTRYFTQLFNRYATYNGSDPYRAPATLSLIPHIEFHHGAYLPEGGMIAITQALYQLAVDLGVAFRFNERAERIVHSKYKVRSVKTTCTEYEADIVVSNMDIHPTYHRLIPELKRPNIVIQQPRSSSALIFYWGIKRRFDELDVHNIFFSDNYEEEFNHITHTKTVYHDPTVYVNITSKKVKDDAPDDCENWFVMINTPHNTGQDWDRIISESRKNILNKLNRLLHTSLEEYIECESVLDPRSIESKTSSYLGALYGNSSNNRMAAFFRHKNFSSELRGLYFCGGSVHPGGGIPLCLYSATITADLIHENNQ